MSTDTRQRTYDWDDPTPTALAGLDQDGLTVLRAIGSGALPLPPAVKTLGIEPVEADPGRVRLRLELGEHHLNPFGIVHGGALLDTAMGCAVHSLLPAGVGYVTGELNVRFLRPAPSRVAR
jgi:acyl-coenzyme A thioesterase PaaI-like protein